MSDRIRRFIYKLTEITVILIVFAVISPASEVKAEGLSPEESKLVSFGQEISSNTTAGEEIVGQEEGITLPTDDMAEIQLQIIDFKEEQTNYPQRQEKRSSDYSVMPSYELPADDKSDTDYGYSKLTSVQKKLYDALEIEAAKFVSSEGFAADTYTEQPVCTAYIDEPCADTDFLRSFLAFYYDNPYYYWLAGMISGARDSNNHSYIYIYVDSEYYTPSSRKTAEEAISTTTKEWYDELSALDNDYDKVLGLHDIIIEAVDYTYDKNGNPEESKWAHNIAGIMTGEGAVCEAYARTFQYMLNLLSIDNLYIVGNAGGGRHAWNAVKLEDKYYLVDVTWDDFNNGGDSGEEAGVYYDFFCSPNSKFSQKHSPDRPSATDSSWLYELPSFEDTTKYVYYYKYGSYADSATTANGVSSFVSNAKNSGRGDFVYFVTDSQDRLTAIVRELGITGGYSYRPGVFGFLYIARNITVNKPAATVKIICNPVASGDSVSIEVGGSVELTAQLTPSDSDDRISWSVDNETGVKLVKNGRTLTVTGKKNCTVNVTATAYQGKVTASCRVVVGTGASTADYIIWANGSKLNKSVTLSPTIAATNWTDTRGKSKTGKLVYIVMADKTDIVFDTTKHTVKTKSNKKYASVTTKGKVTAKAGGTAYVYVCDTGSCKAEEFEIEVKACPTKLILTGTAGSAAKADIIKKIGLDTGDTSDRIYIFPYIKNGTVHEDCTYKIEFAKAEQAANLSFSKIILDDNDRPYFTINALSHDTAKNKVASVKLNVICNENGKKTYITVYTGNPVGSVSAAASGTSLTKKKDTVKLTLSYSLPAGTVSKTTDKLKVYVGKTSVSVSGKRVTYDRGATVKAKLEKNGTITLTANKDAGTEAVIYLSCTDSITKEIKLYKLALVDASGKVTVI